MKRDCNYVGPALARLRAERDLTQEEVAIELQKRGIDISRQIVANIECCRRCAKDKYIYMYHFARLYGVTVESLYNGISKRAN